LSIPFFFLLPTTTEIYTAPVKPQSTQEAFDAEQVILAYSEQYRVNFDELWAVMMCESGASTTARGRAGEVGIFQYMPATFKQFSQEFGQALDIENPRHQVELTAWAFSLDYKYHWTCWRNMYQVY